MYALGKDMGRTINKIASIVFLLLLFGLSLIAAQSGRKPEKPTKPTPPTTSGTTTQPSTPPTDNPGSSTTTTASDRTRPTAEKAQIIVADDGSTKSDRYAKAMVESFITRLDETQATSSYVGQLKKNQAAARAKTENNGWVVYVETHVDRFGSGMTYGQPDMTFNYIVYKAGSDQEMAKGKVKMQGTNSSSSGRGPLGIPQPVPTGSSGKSTPEETGRAAADQVMITIRSNTRTTR